MEKIVFTFFILTVFVSCNKGSEGLRVITGKKAIEAYHQVISENGIQTIDVNKDGKIDFSLQFESYLGLNNETFYFINLVNSDTNQFSVAQYPPPYYFQQDYTVKLFEEGEEINAIENFGNNSKIHVLAKIVDNTPLPGDYVYIKWETRTAYIGVMRLDKGKEKYGWIKMAVPSHTEAYFLESCLLK